jgi:4-aminobutyrate---pyruvate transaminase
MEVLMPELAKQDIAHVLHPNTMLSEHEQFGPLVITRGQGIRLWDSEDREYIDGFAGLWNVLIGYGRHELAEVAAEQIKRLSFCSSFAGMSNPPAIRLAAKLAEITPEGMSHFFFTSGGSESNEQAFKLAWRYHYLRGDSRKIKIVSLWQGFHGVTLGAVSASGTGHREGTGPLAPWFLRIPPPCNYGSPAGAEYPNCTGACADALEDLVAVEGADSIAAFIMEPVLGAGGLIFPSDEYMRRIRQICQRHNILMIADEIVTGFGRTGKTFGVEHSGIKPDLCSMSKGIISGYLPMGAVGISDEVYRGLVRADKAFQHGLTNTAHPVTCAVALKNIEIILEEDLVGNAARVGASLLAKLQRLYQYPWVGEVRGRGLLAAIELVTDRETKERFAPSVRVGDRLRSAAQENGLIVRAIGNVIGLAPSLCLTEAECDDLAGRMQRAIEALEPVWRAARTA